MSNIVDIIQSAQGGQIIENLSDRLGLASWQTRSAVEALLPALVAALRNAAEEPQSLRPVIDAANDSAHRAAFESAEDAHSQASVEGGDAIVAHLFGSASAAGEVSQFAARESGLRADVLQRLLPILVSVAAGGLGSTLERQGVGHPAEQPAPTPAAPSGGWLSALFGSLFGNKPAAQPQAATPAKAADTLDAARDHIRETLTPPANADGQAGLDELLARIFASAKS
ncbi:DUF937 domain-containing protein [Methylosinus sp. H3A]|uniref:DUF937 domain-containing protein n=1 Tax=Methylosinus sp. H3A TaxID=2785786 RepID=UPI0018C28D74|nr:DUF937 domain-containing protein [Methylosinus sp. H3A]MBG0808979.1 DUF937 domain-containing protein [Methylosinus sp. H3A]